MMKTWWLSNIAMTVKVVVDHRGIIVDAAPIVRKFVGQPFENVCKWMNKRSGMQRVLLTPTAIRGSDVSVA